MKPYPKTVMSNQDLLTELVKKGMNISDQSAAIDALEQIGYYRLRGYAFHFIDPQTQKFIPNTNFTQVLDLYRFNSELSSLLFAMTSKIEVALRARLCEALLSTGDALVYLDSSQFKNKKDFWQNLSKISSEIARSNEVFIDHNFKQHDGQIPIWAAVEILSFGSLSKLICNMSTGSNSAFHKLAKNYCYTTAKGKSVTPSMDMMSSWMHATVILRNMCAHNSRIYNRSMNKKPIVLDCDRQSPLPNFYGLYHFMLSMKYLRPSDSCWRAFMIDFDSLIQKYGTSVNLSRLHLPNDWKNHMVV